MMPSELLELGREAADKVAAEVRTGASLVRCQLLASRFYDALKLRFEQAARPDDATHRMAAALRQCLRAADASISPQRMLTELRSAVATLEFGGQASRTERIPPTLRLIQGGLARR